MFFLTIHLTGTLLPWKQANYAITQLYESTCILSSYQKQLFLGTKWIADLHVCYGNTATMATKELCNNSTARQYFKSIFGTNIVCGNTSIMDNLVAMKTMFP